MCASAFSCFTRTRCLSTAGFAAGSLTPFSRAAVMTHSSTDCPARPANSSLSVSPVSANARSEWRTLRACMTESPESMSGAGSLSDSAWPPTARPAANNMAM